MKNPQKYLDSADGNLTQKLRLLKPAALGLYFTVFVDGIIYGIFDGFYAFFLIDELNISQEWFGKEAHCKKENKYICIKEN